MKQIHARVEVLDESDIRQIHAATLELLSTVGCHLPHRRVLDRLAAAGAAVDYATAHAKLPPALVEAALRAVGGPPITGEGKFDAGVLPCPRSVGQGTGAPGRRVGISPGNQANIVDYRATERRQGATEDVLRGLVLCNELPYVRRAMPLVTPADCPQVMGDLYGYYLCALYSKKPYGVYIMTPEAARQIIRIAEIAARDARPSVNYLLEPNGALSYDEISLEMALTFVEAGHGFHVGPMAMAGLDAPVSLAGTLVMQNCYNLIAIVIAHLWDTGCNWSGSAHTMDLRSALCSFGSPNQVLLGWAATQLGNWYGFQVGANCALTDACLPDFQGGFEKGMSAIAMLLAGAGYGAQGIVGADQGASLEQLVIDNEWASALDHIFSLGVQVNEETLAVEAIRRVGIRGSFAADEHTIRHMRETYWRSTIFNHEGWDGWMAKGGQDAYARAHEVVQGILARGYPPPLVVSEAVKHELDALIADAAAHPERFQGQRYQYAAP